MVQRHCPACGHDLDQPPPDPPPRHEHCPCHDACLVCTVTIELDGDIDKLTAALRDHKDVRP